MNRSFASKFFSALAALVIISGAISILFTHYITSSYAAGSSSPWPINGFDATDNAINPLDTTFTTQNVGSISPKWSQSTLNITSNSSPLTTPTVTVDNGIIYTAWNTDVYGLSEADGHVVYHLTLTDPTDKLAPQLYQGNLYVATYVYVNGGAGVVFTLHAFNATDATKPQLWQAQVGGVRNASYTIAGGVVYSGTPWTGNGTGNNITAYNALTGSQLWSTPAPCSTESSFPAIDAQNGIGIFNCAGGELFAVHTSDGSQIYTATVPTETPNDINSPVISNGVVYTTCLRGGVGCTNPNIAALNEKSGAILWQEQVGNILYAMPLVVNSDVYVEYQASNNNMQVSALNASNGQILWTTGTSYPYYSEYERLAYANGILFTGDRVLTAFNASNGNILLNNSSYLVMDTNPVVADGMFLQWMFNSDPTTGQLDFTLYAFTPPGSPTPSPSPSPSPSPTPPPSPQLKQLSSDSYTNSTSQHKTEVEPDTFSFGSMIVSAFQVGRFSDGGSANIGWATSTDQGSTWKHGFLPGITKVVNSTNPYDRVSDASVAYDAAHKTWMVASLAITVINGSPIGSAVLVSRSKDGLSWNKPVKVASAGSFSYFDKSWIVCDDTAASKFYGHCYIEWDNHGRNGGEFYFNGLMLMSTTTDGGLTWGSQQHSTDSAHGIGGQPLVQPNGTVIVPFLRTFLTSSEQDIAAFTSTTGGTSWSNTVTIAIAKMHTVGGNLRSDLPLPSAEIDGSGKVYVVWSDCQLEPNCSTNDIVMSSSTDGVKWNGVTVIPLDPFGTSVDHFISGIAVDKSTSGNNAHLVLIFYYYPGASCTTNCRLYVGFASSTDGGNHWSARMKLAGPMTLSWLANTSGGYMVGDYISASFSGGKAYPVFAVAKTSSGTVLNEAMYTVVGGLS